MAVGRPIDEAKTAIILGAARDIFFAQGFAHASIEAIAAQAGVSKVTIYNRFGTKEALFSNMVAQECDRMRSGLQQVTQMGDNIAETLTYFALNMTEFLAHDDITRIEAHLAVEAEHNPDLGKLFLDAGPRRLQKFLAMILADAHESGQLNIDDADEAAELFAGMVKGFADMDRRFRQNGPDAKRKAEKRISSAVRLFIKGYGVS